MAENSPSGKRKTLYGRYDDYAASEEDSAAGGNRAFRLSDMPAPRQGRRGAGGSRPEACPQTRPQPHPETEDREQ